MALVLVIVFSVLVGGALLTDLHDLWPWNRSGAGVVTTPYGLGSRGPLADNSMPEGFPIKGNADSMLYHRTDSRSYGATKAEVWFDTAASAEAAGFSLANSHPAV